MTIHIDLTDDRTDATAGRSADARDRALHLIDIENLSGGPSRHRDEHLAAYRAYVRRAEVRPGDHVVVAACGLVMCSVGFALPSGIAKRTANGADGADAELLGFASVDLIAARYDRLVIGSGDHAFVDLALAVQARGTTVLVVTGRGRRSCEFAGHGFGLRDLGLDDDLGLIA